MTLASPAAVSPPTTDAEDLGGEAGGEDAAGAAADDAEVSAAAGAAAEAAAPAAEAVRGAGRRESEEMGALRPSVDSLDWSFSLLPMTFSCYGEIACAYGV